MSVAGNGDSIILSSATEFSDCQTEVPMPFYCVYFDEVTLTLSIFSNSKQLTTGPLGYDLTIIF